MTFDIGGRTLKLFDLVIYLQHIAQVISNRTFQPLPTAQKKT